MHKNNVQAVLSPGSLGARERGRLNYFSTWALRRIIGCLWDKFVPNCRESMVIAGNWDWVEECMHDTFLCQGWHRAVARATHCLGVCPLVEVEAFRLDTIQVWKNFSHVKPKLFSVTSQKFRARFVVIYVTNKGL